MFFIGAVLRWAVLVIYLFCSYLYISPLVGARGQRMKSLALPLLIVAVVLHALLLVETIFELGRLNFLRTALQATTLYAIVLAVSTLVVEARTRNAAYGAFAVPIALVLYIVSLIDREPHLSVNPRLDSYWFEIHITTAFVGYTGFCLAFVAAVMYLILAGEIRRRNLGRVFTRMPSLESLDQIGYGAAALGFLFFTLALVTGGIWAHQDSGHFWSGELKEIMSVVTWAVFALYLVTRLRAGWRGRRSAILSILGFAASMITYIGGGAGSGRHVL